MAFGGFEGKGQPAPMSEINVTPMVDVMLVLLVIFILTAPLFTHAVRLDLPNARSAPAPEKPDTISVSINSQGKIYLNNEVIAQPELEARLSAAAQKQPIPELQLRADKETRYEVIAQVMSSAQTSGLTKIGFVTVPKETGQ